MVTGRVSEKNPAMAFSAELSTQAQQNPPFLPDGDRGEEKNFLLFYPFPLFQWGSVSLKISFPRDISVLPLTCHTETTKNWGERGLLWVEGADLAGRTLHRPVHSTVCSDPRPGKGCKCQHTWVQSESKKKSSSEKLLFSSASAVNLQSWNSLAPPAVLWRVKITFQRLDLIQMCPLRKKHLFKLQTKL